MQFLSATSPQPLSGLHQFKTAFRAEEARGWEPPWGLPNRSQPAAGRALEGGCPNSPDPERRSVRAGALRGPYWGGERRVFRCGCRLGSGRIRVDQRPQFGNGGAQIRETEPHPVEMASMGGQLPLNGEELGLESSDLGPQELSALILLEGKQPQADQRKGQDNDENAPPEGTGRLRRPFVPARRAGPGRERIPGPIVLHNTQIRT